MEKEEGSSCRVGCNRLAAVNAGRRRALSTCSLCFCACTGLVTVSVCLCVQGLELERSKGSKAQEFW